MEKSRRRERLLSEWFQNWSRHDFVAFIRVCERQECPLQCAYQREGIASVRAAVVLRRKAGSRGGGAGDSGDIGEFGGVRDKRTHRAEAKEGLRTCNGGVHVETTSEGDTVG
jgi:hypothetical protein